MLAAGSFRPRPGADVGYRSANGDLSVVLLSKCPGQDDPVSGEIRDDETDVAPVRWRRRYG
jgi:hypothetical protein